MSGNTDRTGEDNADPGGRGLGGSKQSDHVDGPDCSAELPGSQGKRELGWKRAFLSEREDV